MAEKWQIMIPSVGETCINCGWLGDGHTPWMYIMIVGKVRYVCSTGCGARVEGLVKIEASP